MKYPVAFLWFNHTKSKRLLVAQQILENGIAALGLDPLRIPAGEKLITIGSVLSEARKVAAGEAIVWCNSDLILTRNPFDVPQKDIVYGFHRREIPSGEMGKGIDMYTIPIFWWDEYLSRDIPQLYLGASYVDRWVSRAMDKRNGYMTLNGYIDHITHPSSAAAGSDANPYYQKNFRSYNKWALRNGLEPIPAPPFLVPRLGHVWGVRDGISRIIERLSSIS